MPGGVVFIAAVVAAAAVGYGLYSTGKGVGQSWFDALSQTIGGWADAWIEVF